MTISLAWLSLPHTCLISTSDWYHSFQQPPLSLHSTRFSWRRWARSRHQSHSPWHSGTAPAQWSPNRLPLRLMYPQSQHPLMLEMLYFSIQTNITELLSCWLGIYLIKLGLLHPQVNSRWAATLAAHAQNKLYLNFFAWNKDNFTFAHSFSTILAISSNGWILPMLANKAICTVSHTQKVKGPNTPHLFLLQSGLHSLGMHWSWMHPGLHSPTCPRAPKASATPSHTLLSRAAFTAKHVLPYVCY